MADYVLEPLEIWQSHDRKVVDTGLSLIGRGGNAYLCGHCGKQIMSNMRLNTMEPSVIFKCGGCGGLNDRPAEDKILTEQVAMPE